MHLVRRKLKLKEPSLTQNFRGPVRQEIWIHVDLSEPLNVEVAEVEGCLPLCDPLSHGSTHPSTTHYTDRAHPTRQHVVLYLKGQHMQVSYRISELRYVSQ